MRGRPPRPIGVPGDVDLAEVRPGVWRAKLRVRDASGKRRQIMRVSPPRTDSRGRPVPDRDGARARDAVLGAASDLSVSVLDAELSTETTIRALYYDHYRPYLVDQGRAPATLDRYDFEAKGFDSAFGHRRLMEAPTPVMEKFLTTVAETRGAGAAKSSRTVLSGMYNYAIRMSNGAIMVNPLREVKLARRKGGKRGGARQLNVDEVRDILIAIRTSDLQCPRILAKAEREKGIESYTPPTVAEFCADADIVDWIVMLIATSHRRSQSLATTWPELDLKAGVMRPTRKLIRVKGRGLVLVPIEDDTKGSDNEIALPQFAIDALKIRKRRLAERRLVDPRPAPTGCEDLVFPSENWTPRDPNNVAAQWRRVRSALGLPVSITAHSFRKAVATILDDAGLSARIAADVLGHADPSMTQRFYMARGRAHSEAATALHQAIAGEP
ncbi:phage integrase [Mycobacteroides stephanolepidis]|uniref:Phage integrase n=1 Tax=[Mycobacterium] stephanolepidis TaxID=1520670 RepID=A0A1Z4F0R7_9MYCO|nr:phage integrase [[Mycobacterium] stephanolepidis]